MYVWALPQWPKWTWGEGPVEKPLALARHQQGLLLGRMQALGFRLQAEATLTTLTEDVLKTSEIEGERLDAREVRSSIARPLGMDVAGLVAVVLARVTRGEKTVTLEENPSTFIPIGMTHRLENPGAAPLILIEVQSRSFLGEDDIARFGDCYNRE